MGAAWDEVRGVTVFPATGRLYVVSRATLYSIDSKTGQYDSIGDYGGWTDCRGICASGGSHTRACCQMATLTFCDIR